MVPMMATTRAVRPPMPMPWMTRAVSRIGTLCAKPAITEPMTKMTIALWTRTFLLNRSASLPQMGVEAALASNALVMTQAYAVCVPFRSPIIVGRAVATIVLLSSAVNSAASRPVRASRIWRCVMAVVSSTGGRVCVSVIRFVFQSGSSS